MPVNDELGKRMKRYESIPQISLMRRTPVAIRIDGKAFHTFTKHLHKPWDNLFQGAMQDTMKYLCENIQNCVFGYQQSDEITLILTDYETLTTDAWFGYEVQKLCSISASMATMKFNKALDDQLSKHIEYLLTINTGKENWLYGEEEDYVNAVNRAVLKGAMFDARCFNIPKEEVTNLVYWRQLDAMRNSVLSLGQVYYSERQLHGASCEVIKEMLRQDNIDWDDLPIAQQHGVACRKNESNGWYIDYNMPILKGDNRSYVEDLI